MIDLCKETIIHFGEVKGQTPFKVNHSTLHRWRMRGIRGVFLETAMVGGRRVTSLEALQRFSNRLSEGEPSATQDQKRAHIAAESELAAMGI